MHVTYSLPLCLHFHPPGILEVETLEVVGPMVVAGRKSIQLLGAAHRPGLHSTALRLDIINKGFMGRISRISYHQLTNVVIHARRFILVAGLEGNLGWWTGRMFSVGRSLWHLLVVGYDDGWPVQRRRLDDSIIYRLKIACLVAVVAPVVVGGA